jgi:NADH dehydrogenase
MQTLFITGATGFIGSHLLPRLNSGNFRRIYSLSPSGPERIPQSEKYEKVRFLRGSLFDTESYSDYLTQSDIVIHLAALTGKAEPEAYFKVNKNGTDILIDQCKKHGVEKFLYISSIAAAFKKISNYPYAQSKLQAEQSVKASGISYAILRPTMVIGQGSPVLTSLLKLVKAPVTPIFGTGHTIIQPIYVYDLVSCIQAVIENEVFSNETLEIGGPEQISIEDFINRLNNLSSNKRFRPFHIPIGPVAVVLQILEKQLLSLLPFTVGQLASFSNDGTIVNNHLFDQHVSLMKRVDQMIRLSLRSSEEQDSPPNLCKKECEQFTRYLAGCNPTEYIKKKYLEGHKASRIVKNNSYFDNLLIRSAVKNTFVTRLVDVYTSVFYRNAVIRQKMVLLLAILESCPATYDNIDTVKTNYKVLFYLKLLNKTVLFFLLLFLSTVIFVPFQTVKYTPFRRITKKIIRNG